MRESGVLAMTASIYYVDPVTGDDNTNDGLSPATPFKTIAHASQELAAGDTLRLHAGSIYGPTTAFSGLAGTLEAPIDVEPYAGTEVVFDGRITAPDFATVPNSEWEPVPGGHPEEWRTRQILDEPQLGGPDAGEVRHGALADSGIRLIAYSRIEDLRATNESYPHEPVPLSDPRPAGGPLEKDLTRKRPWTYFGPGLAWVPEHLADAEDRRGRVHVRLSRTHLRTPGIRDYAGSSDPNQVALALTPERRVVVRVAGSNLRFRNLFIANGGERTLIIQQSRNVTFDHCTVQGGRFGVRMAELADGVRFEHCTFDGGLAPWTMRSDVKESYTYIDPVLGRQPNGTGRLTHDHLVLVAADNVEFDSCTFRRGHDALQLGGTNVSVHHSLFEDLNDEVMQFNFAINVRIYKNLIRQVLHPLSFLDHDKDPERRSGPVYVYRNVIDQRVPTRGYRALPPDTPVPHVWRYGASHKLGHPMPDVYVFQNTFISSHLDDKADALTPLFNNGFRSPEAPRIHLNNLLVGLNLDLPYSFAMPTAANRRSQGNLWYQAHRDDAALFMFQRPDGSSEPVETLAGLHELDGGWELGSRFEDPKQGPQADPQLVNFDDEFFDHGRYLGDAYPDNDFGPAPGSPAIAAGVALPPELLDLDPDRPTDSSFPDIGAIPAGSPPLRVGADQAVVLPAPATPVAHAGPDQLLVDADHDGFEPVTVDGTGSVDPGGTITQYRWTEPGVTLASAATATLALAEGDHYLRLTVTNSAGNTDTDGLQVQIRPPQPHGDNLLRCPGFEETPCGWALRHAWIVASPVHSGRRALTMDPLFGQPIAHQRVLISPGATYRISAWVRRGMIPVPPLLVRAVFVDNDDTQLQTTDFPFAAGAEYVYREGTTVAPQGAVAMDLFLGGNLGSGLGRPAFFDDVRVLDRNLLTNAGFETRSPTGLDKHTPGWRFEDQGARVVTEPANVRSGARAVALEGLQNDVSQVTQVLRNLTGAPRYRVSAWLKTGGLTVAPTIVGRFDTGGGDQSVAPETSEGAYRYVSGEVTAPPGAKRLTIRLQLVQGATGTAYFDDLLLEPLQ
jgi:hypothetical protein